MAMEDHKDACSIDLFSSQALTTLTLTQSQTQAQAQAQIQDTWDGDGSDKTLIKQVEVDNTGQATQCC